MRDLLDSAIKSLKEDDGFWIELVEKSNAQSGPFDGGCLICAKAIIMGFGQGRLVRITSNLNGGQTEHYGALVGGYIYDMDGLAEASGRWIERFAENEQVFDRDLFYAEGYDEKTGTPDDPRSVKSLSRILIDKINHEMRNPENRSISNPVL